MDKSLVNSESLAIKSMRNTSKSTHMKRIECL